MKQSLALLGTLHSEPENSRVMQVQASWLFFYVHKPPLCYPIVSISCIQRKTVNCMLDSQQIFKEGSSNIMKAKSEVQLLGGRYN